MWYNGQSCITLFHFCRNDFARRNVGKFVPYLYRIIFNDKVDYLKVKILTIIRWVKVRYRYQRSANIVETPSWQKPSRRGIVVISVLGLHPTTERKWSEGKKVLDKIEAAGTEHIINCQICCQKSAKFTVKNQPNYTIKIITSRYYL